LGPRIKVVPIQDTAVQFCKVNGHQQLLQHGNFLGSAAGDVDGSLHAQNALIDPPLECNGELPGLPSDVHGALPGNQEEMSGANLAGIDHLPNTLAAGRHTETHH
jgi:hypothetical protein